MLITQRLLGTPNGLSLVGRGFLSEPLSLTRAQLTGVQSSAINSTNDGLTFYGADVPRFNGPAQRLLIGGQRTNGIRNPRQEGAATGTPGTSPTNMTRNSSGGITQGEIIATGVDQGLPYVDYRLTGTVATTGVWTLNLEGTNIIAALTGQTWTGSWFWRLVNVVSGGPNNWQMNVTEADSGGSLVLENTVSMTAATTASLGSQRVSNTVTLSGGASTAFVRTRVRLLFPAGTHDITIRIAVPQLERGAFASSPTLPPVGTPGASTRGTDLISSPLSALGVGNHQVVTEITTSGGSTSVLIIPRPLSTLTGLRVFINGTEVFGFSLQDDPFDPGNSTWVVFGSSYPSGTLMVATIPVTSCTILWSGVIPSFVPGGVHTIACVDDGSVSNRFTMRVDQASGQLQAMRALAGASATANAGAVTAGTPFKGGITIDTLTGTAGVSLNGNTVAEVTGGSLLSLTQFRLGNIFDASTPMWGETSYLRLIPNKVSYTELQSLTGALP